MSLAESLATIGLKRFGNFTLIQCRLNPPEISRLSLYGLS
jgi:hypothetical protein